MKPPNAQLKTLRIFLSQHWASTLAMLYPLIIFIDYSTLPLPEHIYQGQPFFYAWYMDNLTRERMLILIGILLFFVLLVRSIFIFESGAFRFVPPIVFFTLSLLLVLWLASTPATSGATHLETTPVLNQAKFNLYSEFSSGQFQLEAVLVKCDSIGLICYFVQKWEHKWTLDSQPDAHLSTNPVNNSLSVLINGEVVYTHPVQ